MTKPLKPVVVLLVEDSPEDAKLILRELKQGGFDVAPTRVTNADELRVALARPGWDVILCDFSLPHFSGEAALDMVRASGCDAPVIFVSGTIGEETAVNAMRLGARDYVMKDNLARLAPAVERELRETVIRRQAQAADVNLRESEHKYRHLFESLNDAAFLFAETNGVIIDTNLAAERLLHLRREEIIGRRHADLYTRPLPEQPAPQPDHEAEIATAGSGPVPVRVSLSRVALHERSFILALVRDITPQRVAAAALRASEALHRSVVTAMAEGLIFWAADGRVTAVNPAAERILGRPATDMLGCTSSELKWRPRHEDGTPFTRETDPSLLALRTGAPQLDVIMQIERPDGETRWISSNSQPLNGAAGARPHGVVTTLHDITEHRRAEAELRASEERFSRVFDLSPTAICVIRVADGQFVAVNEAFMRMVGYSREELVGRTTTDLALWTNPDQRAATIASLREHGSLGVHRIHGRRRNGELVVGLGATTVMNLKGESFYLSLIHDVTDLERAEEARRESEERFRQVTENIGEVFWLTDATKSRIIYVSPAYQAVWGRSCESLYAAPQSWLQAVHEGDRDRVAAAVRQQATGTYDIEYRINRPDGAIRWIHDRAFRVLDTNGNIYRIAGIAEDVTDRRRLEEQFRQAQKMEAIGQLAGGIAHDFNNLLTIVTMQCSLLLSEMSHNTEIAPGLQQVLDAANRGVALTRQLLTFSRRGLQEDARPIDLADQLGAMTKLLRRILGEQIEVDAQLPRGLAMVLADPGKMEQVLMNLVINARDAMPNGGRLGVRIDLVSVDEEHATQHPSARVGRFVRLSVADTGCGIPPDVLPRIFEPFFTTKEAGKGTGLGLATVFGIVLQHRGWIEVDSTIGVGTTFRVYLPELNRPVARPAITTPQLSKAGGHETILLVEDEDMVRSIAVEALRRDGYRVLEARTGAEALRLCRDNSTKIDLMLTDVVMPGGMSGQSLAQELHALRPTLKVIYCTGYSSDIAGKLPVRSGWDYLPKPYSIQDLTTIIRRRLDGEPPA